MIWILTVGALVILYIFYSYRENKFKEIERQQAMRRAVLKVNENNRRFSH